MKRVGGFEYGLVQKQVRPTQPMTKAQRLELARRRQAQLVQAGVRPRYMPLAGYRSNNYELKGADGDVNYDPVIATTNTNAGIFVVNCLQPGSGSWNRVGRKIRMRTFRLKGVAVFQQEAVSTAAISNVLRISVVYDKQPSSGSIPTFDTIFGGTDQNGTEATTFRSNVRYDNTERFTVLKDMTTFDSFYLANTAQDKRIPFDFFINLKKLETVYSGQSNPCTIADISTGALYVVFRAALQSANTYVAINNSNYRLRYED